MFKDIDIFLLAAQAIVQGRDPYSIPNLEVFYPLPFYFLFIPLTALPLDAVHVLWTILNAVVLVAILRRRALPVFISAPVFLTFLLGQVDILMMALFAKVRSGIGAGIGLAFLVLKPQLVVLVTPWLMWRWWRKQPRQLIWFLALVSIILLGSWFVQPDWAERLLARSGERTRAAISSSVWGLLAFLPATMWLPVSALVVVALVVWAWRKNNFDIVAAIGMLISPYIFSYNLTPLLVAVRRPVALIAWTILSWAAFAIAAWQSNDRAAAGLSCLVLFELVRPSFARQKSG
jgi:hypothetical protein